MALRIRENGRVLCAAIHPRQVGDTYIDDELHYQMSVVNQVLVTETIEKHRARGEWWWAGAVPDGVKIENPV